MKKLLSLLFILTLLLSLSACGKKEEFNGSPDDIPTLNRRTTSINTYY